MNRENRKLKCSFCGKDESKVSKLVAGPKVYICDGCVVIAAQIMADSREAPSPGPQQGESRI